MYYSDEFLGRYTTNGVYPGCLFIPLTHDRNSFTVIDNDVVRARLYYDNYYDSFPSYQAFLNTLMNNPGIVDIEQAFGFIKSFTTKESISKEANRDFTRFMSKYLRKKNNHYVIDRKYNDLAIHIAKECFIKGYYVYEPTCFSDWVIALTPDICPPLLE